MSVLDGMTLEEGMGILKENIRTPVNVKITVEYVIYGVMSEKFSELPVVKNVQLTSRLSCTHCTVTLDMSNNQDIIGHIKQLLDTQLTHGFYHIQEVSAYGIPGVKTYIAIIHDGPILGTEFYGPTAWITITPT